MKYFYIILLILPVISSCHKEEKITTSSGAKLSFSEDTVLFDTLFTSVGSVTKRLKVYNPNKEAVTIGSIELGGKASSSYSTIIAGQQSWTAANVYLRGGDSLYILVKVTIDPKNINLPFLVSDSLVFRCNGNVQRVIFEAYGQDAAFYKSLTLPCDTTWSNTKPIVIIGQARVAAGCTLTVKKGAKVYFHEQASLKVDGTLIVQGEKDTLVTFAGDRLQAAYAETGGQWEGIVFDSLSKNNHIAFALIKNAVTGITINADPADTDTIPDLVIANTIVKNMQKQGVLAYGSDVYAFNSLFTNSVDASFAGLGGGNYYFTHCSFADYSYDFFREESALRFTTSAPSGTAPVQGPLKARLVNCIVWGDAADEITTDNANQLPFDLSVSSSILKTTDAAWNVQGNILNQDPLFTSPVIKDFHLSDTSPAIDAGQPAGITIDLDGKPRDTHPDIGAYEK